MFQQPPRLRKYGIEHIVSQPPGVGVVSTAVIRIEQSKATEVMQYSMAEFVIRLPQRERLAGFLTGLIDPSGDCRIDAEEIVQRVSIFGLCQSSNDEGTWVLGAEKLDFGDPLAEL